MVDMQLFVLSPLIVYPLWRWRNKFIPMIPALVLLSMACTFTTFMVNHYNASKLNAGNDIGRYEKTYVPAHTRFGAWGIGILFGYILHVTKSKPVQLSNVCSSHVHMSNIPDIRILIVFKHETITFRYLLLLAGSSRLEPCYR